MERDDHAHLLDALAAIDPATLDYSQWVECGMALHDSGYDWSDWADPAGVFVRFEEIAR